jgi:hypothetical protein
MEDTPKGETERKATVSRNTVSDFRVAFSEQIYASENCAKTENQKTCRLRMKVTITNTIISLTSC